MIAMIELACGRCLSQVVVTLYKVSREWHALGQSEAFYVRESDVLPGHNRQLER